MIIWDFLKKWPCKIQTYEYFLIFHIGGKVHAIFIRYCILLVRMSSLTDLGDECGVFRCGVGVPVRTLHVLKQHGVVCPVQVKVDTAFAVGHKHVRSFGDKSGQR